GYNSHRDWVVPLLGPYIERRIQDFIPGSALAVTLEKSEEGPSTRRQRTIDRLLDRPVSLQAPSDAYEEVSVQRNVCVAHVGDVTLAVAGGPPISCDVRCVGADVSAARRELFPSKESKVLTELISADVREDRNTAAARVESADECLKNACVSAEAGLRLLS